MLLGKISDLSCPIYILANKDNTSDWLGSISL